MNKVQKIVLLSFILIIGVITTYLFERGTRETSENFALEEEVNMIKGKSGNINVWIDPRIELLSSVYINGDNLYLNSTNSKYLEDMKEYFKPYSEYKVIDIFKKLHNEDGYSYNSSIISIMNLTNPPELKQNLDYNENFINKLGEEKNLKEFNDKLRDYAVATKFNKYYNKNKKSNEKFLETFNERIKGNNYVNDLEEYYGLKQNSYNIVISNSIAQEDYNLSIKNSEKSINAYAILGFKDLNKEVNEIEKDYFGQIVSHEFSHSFINPLTESHLNEINKYAELYNPIAGKMTSLNYLQWKTCVNEHIIRAVNARLIEIKKGNDASDKFIKSEEDKGFIYIRPICDLLKEYEKNKAKYKNIEEFYSEIIILFKNIYEGKVETEFKNYAFDGGFINAYLMVDPIVVIIPTNEKDKDMGKNITEKINSYPFSKLKEIKIVKDTDAVNQKFENNTVIALGTIDGNTWLKKNKDIIPFKIDSKKITCGKDIVGENLSLITVLPNPNNPKKALIVVTAQKAEDILLNNYIIDKNEKEKDYIIYKNNNMLQSESYIKKNGKWSFK